MLNEESKIIRFKNGIYTKVRWKHFRKGITFKRNMRIKRAFMRTLKFTTFKNLLLNANYRQVY